MKAFRYDNNPYKKAIITDIVIKILRIYYAPLKHISGMDNINLLCTNIFKNIIKTNFAQQIFCRELNYNFKTNIVRTNLIRCRTIDDIVNYIIDTINDPEYARRINTMVKQGLIRENDPILLLKNNLYNEYIYMDIC